MSRRILRSNRYSWELPTWMGDLAACLISGTIVGFIVAGLMFLAGCRQWKPAPTSTAIAVAASQAQSVSDPVIRAEVRRQTIQRESETAAKAVADRPAAAAPVATIRAEAVAQKDDLADAIKKLEAAGNGYAKALKLAEEDRAALEHLRGQWYVGWGVWIERSIWTIAIGWIVLNVIAFAGGVGSPVGWFGMLAKQLRLFMPGMNPASWAIAAWKGLA